MLVFTSAWAFSLAVVSRGHPLVAVLRLLPVAASLVAERRLLELTGFISYGSQAPWGQARELQPTGSAVPWYVGFSPSED